MSRVWTICAVALSVLGCQSGEVPKRGANRGVDPPIAHQPASGANDPGVDPPWPEPRELQRIVVGTTVQEPERDLGAELHASLGSLNDCLRDFATSSSTTLRISVSGIVRPTGMIIEPSAYASGLSEDALRCVRERVGLVVLKPLEDASVSETASTVIEVNYEPPVALEVDTGVLEPDLPDVVHPRPKIPPIKRSGIPITDPYWGWLHGGNVKEIESPPHKRITGPKPRAIDGYRVDENAQDWD